MVNESKKESLSPLELKARMEQGLTYGAQRDDVLKKHPDLLPYSFLPEKEKEYDRASAMIAIKSIINLG